MSACGSTRWPSPLQLLLPLLLLALHSSLLSLTSASQAAQSAQPVVRIMYPQKGQILSGCNWINFTAVVHVNNVASDADLKVTFHIDNRPISQATGEKDLSRSYGSDIIYSFNVEFDIETANETDTYGNLARAVASIGSDVVAEHEIMFGTHVVASPKKFIYLVQNEHALDLSQLYGPRSDVIQLAFKVPPPKPSADVIWAPNTTWNSGRNLLFDLALQRQKDLGLCYMYFVFRDGDCQLEEVIDFGHNTGNPYRTFEKYLTMTRPAVGFARYDSFQEFDASKEYQLGYNFDQLFVAVHHDATNLLLPYGTQWDKESWSHPSRIFTMLSAAHFHRHRIQFNALRSVDFKSGTYPAFGGFINPLSWLLPAFQTKEQVWSLRYIKEDWGHARPGEPALAKGEYRYAVNSFDKCHPYFLPKASGDLRGCPFFDPQAKTNFIMMQLIEGLVEDNKALRAELAAQRRQQQQQQQATKDVLARLKAMCVTNPCPHLPTSSSITHTRTRPAPKLDHSTMKYIYCSAHRERLLHQVAETAVGNMQGSIVNAASARATGE